MEKIIFTGTFWNAQVFLSSNGGKAKRLKNWYGLDKFKKDNESFAWGYRGTGPRMLSYSMLRELLGKEIAEHEYRRFAEILTYRLDSKKGFEVSNADIEELLKTNTFSCNDAGVFCHSEIEGFYSEESIRKRFGKESDGSQKRGFSRMVGLWTRMLEGVKNQ